MIMVIRFVVVCLVALIITNFAAAATSVTQHGITWTFDGDYQVGQFVTGDWWVVGPVTITGIATNLHEARFTVTLGDDGSMVNPGGTSKQGYDAVLSSYDASLNAGLIGGQRVSASNPLVLPPHSSLVSMVSWLYNSVDDTEVGCPPVNGGTGAPRPVTRSGAVLTVLPAPAPEGSFRPPYCGSDKTIKFNVSQVNLNKLKNLDPVASTPSVSTKVNAITRPWIDHVYQYLGAMVHPSENMPNYGREIARHTGEIALMLNLDFSQLTGSPDKMDLLIPYVQMGIDFAGIADVGGGWPANGGHHPGRKLPILVAGLVLDDDHMLGAGDWDTEFHDDLQTFYVTQAEVDITNGPTWNPDSRASEIEPYEVSDIGMPEWGIRHIPHPWADNRGWTATYRSVNGAVIPGQALGAVLSQVREAWNHEAYFDYAVRYMEVSGFTDTGTNAPTTFMKDMWTTYGAYMEQKSSAMIFYNNSAFDGNDAAAGGSDDDAIAVDKQVLLPGEIASFANYTSYDKGINGIMVDIAELPGAVTATDFEFKVGNNSTPDGWADAPAPVSITVRAGEGVEGKDRVTIIWSDGAITGQWLQVTVKATAATGLAKDDVFYVGNAIGETGNLSSDTIVDATDEIASRNNPRHFVNPAAIDNAHDFNRDGKVDATDQIIARNHVTDFSSDLELITVPR